APLTWIGRRDMAATASGHDDMHRPVRIRASAFAPDVPHRDLLVTPEHCVFTDGILIPARMLVNGRSIISDNSIGAYSFFHLELAEHSILLSEGLTTESYLDTGNRTLFADVQPGTEHRSDQVAAAPLAVDRETVESVWQRLDTRAAELGHALAAPEVELTTDPALRVLLDDGREITARWLDQARHFFHIPRGSRPVRLLSRASTPATVVGPFCDDRRRLGIAIERLALWNGLDERVVEAAALPEDGWHGVEGARRWTNGDAALDFTEAQGADTFLEVMVMATLPYPVERQMAA
ncbi:MAG: Hint domain-containing protein, partial [Janthinobacterium lividum]